MEVSEILMNLKKEGNFRKIPGKLPPDYLDFTSNDYLGLASNPFLVQEFLNSVENPRFSSSSSRLLASSQEAYSELESFLAKEYKRTVLLFNSGYHANTGIISAMASDSQTLIIADKLSHASIIDGIILSKADYRRFPHNDMVGLRSILSKNKDKYDNFLVITESIFSMDGDAAPLEELLKIKREFPKVILYLDESHSLGVRGQKGLGMAQENESKEWDIVVYPMGKGAASMGAFVVCSEDTKDFLINRSRSLIYSTALPPVQMQWSLFIFKKVIAMEEERKYLYSISRLLNSYLEKITDKERIGFSHIQPLIIGDSHKTKELSEILSFHKIKALPIRKPTVPAGTERLRFSLSATMKEEDIHRLGNILEDIKCKGNIL